jgi:tripartite-type tricarboxylate transporter receptor subunit TctC
MNVKNIAGAAVLSLFATAATAAYPERDINGIIMWGAGGGTDVVARAVTPTAELSLGKKIVLVNRPGGAGAISTAAVNAAPSDGYTLLYGAENPQIHPVLNLGELDYSKFYPVNVIARGLAVIIVGKDAPWNSMKDLIADAQKQPNKLKMASTGPGGLPYTIGAMINNVQKLPVTSVPFDGDGPGLTAVMGGHADFMPVALGAASEHIKAGRVKALAIVNAEAVPTLPNVPPITRDVPQLAKFLPYGPFYGVWVKRDVPADAKNALVKAFNTAVADPKFVQLMQDRGNVLMNMSGDEADAFLKKWQSVTAWVLQDSGAAKTSPEKFGIPRP